MSFANKTFLLCWQYSLEILKPQNALKENTSLQDKVKANHSPSGNQPDVCIIFDKSYASIQCCFHWNYWEYKSFSEAPDCLQSKAQWTKSNSIHYLHYLVPSYLSDLPPCERPLFWLCGCCDFAHAVRRVSILLPLHIQILPVPQLQCSTPPGRRLGRSRKWCDVLRPLRWCHDLGTQEHLNLILDQSHLSSQENYTHR